jgi:hypothetical protein
MRAEGDRFEGNLRRGHRKMLETGMAMEADRARNGFGSIAG